MSLDFLLQGKLGYFLTSRIVRGAFSLTLMSSPLYCTIPKELPAGDEIVVRPDNDSDVNTDITENKERDGVTPADTYDAPDSPVLKTDILEEITERECTDMDHDGFSLICGFPKDCDDGNTEINPLAQEICDTIDNNCNNLIDENFPVNQACTLGSGECAATGIYSCTDDHLDVFCYAPIKSPVPELCDSLDNDCNGQTDEGFLITFYHDKDNDQHGDPKDFLKACEKPPHYVFDNTDCSDINNTIWVKIFAYNDADKDGFGAGDLVELCVGDTLPEGYALNNIDCDNSTPLIHPAMLDVCDILDNDCNPFTEDGSGEMIPYNSLQAGVCAGSLQHCVSGQWNDNYSTISKFEQDKEISCDGADNNCNGVTDENLHVTSYFDYDEDSFGNKLISTSSCTIPPHYVDNASDCNDALADINPFAQEVCNDIDDNCNTLIDETGQFITLYLDGDHDGFGNKTLSLLSCKPEGGYVTNNEDCDDDNLFVNPSMLEYCDGIDNDCSGSVDEGFSLEQLCTVSTGQCISSGNYICSPDTLTSLCSATPLDPTAEECDGLDNDCNGLIDDALLLPYRQCQVGMGACLSLGLEFKECLGTEGWSEEYVACTAIASKPTEEVCDGIDNDCNNLVDDGAGVPLYADKDQDTFGNPNNSVLSCVLQEGYVLNALDCDDNEININPLAPEICDTLDNDCNIFIDEGFNTGVVCSEGVGACQSIGQYQCSSGGLSVLCNVTTGIPQEEVCNGVDDDCDDLTDNHLAPLLQECSSGVGECLRFGLGYKECWGSAGWSSEYTGCDAVALEPKQELCDSLDNDCDGKTDEAFPLNEVCSMGTGACKSEGIYECSLDGLSTICDAFFLMPGKESCNGIDDNCDEITDNDLVAPQQDCILGSGECAAVGLEYKVCNGSSGWSEQYFNCTAVPLEPSGEICDGLDNDCDGDVDNKCILENMDLIVFRSNRTGNYEIYTIEPSIGEESMNNLTNDPSYDEFPTWSPNKKKIAFNSNRVGDITSIYIMNANESCEDNYITNVNGSCYLPLFQNGYARSWSPDGKKLAFTNDSKISLIDAGGSGEITALGITGNYPVFSPEGDKIAYYDNFHELFVYNLTTEVSTPLNIMGFLPDWHPNNNLLVYITNSSNEITIVNESTTKNTGLNIPGYHPKWHPDGSKIVYSAKDNSQGDADNIYIVNSDGGGIIQLTFDDKTDIEPDW